MTILVFVLGTVLGSYLLCRIQRKSRKESYLFSFSHCDVCGHQLLLSDTIPVASFVMTKGRCRYCHAKLSPIYLFAELAAGLAGSILYIKYGWSHRFLEMASLMMVLLFCSYSDYLTREIYISDLLEGILVFVVLSYKKLRIDRIIGREIWILLFFTAVSFLAEKIWKRESIGRGDIDVFLYLGLYFCIRDIFRLIFLSSLLGSTVLIVKNGKMVELPYVCFITLSLFLYLICP